MQRFFLGGRLIFGPDVRSMIITIFLIVIPVLLFAVFVSQKLVNEFTNELGNLIIIIAVVFAAYVSFFSLISTSFHFSLLNVLPYHILSSMAC